MVQSVKYLSHNHGDQRLSLRTWYKNPSEVCIGRNLIKRKPERIIIMKKDVIFGLSSE